MSSMCTNNTVFMQESAHLKCRWDVSVCTKENVQYFFFEFHSIPTI